MVKNKMCQTNNIQSIRINYTTFEIIIQPRICLEDNNVNRKLFVNASIEALKLELKQLDDVV